jgi:hypothetical protein
MPVSPVSGEDCRVGQTPHLGPVAGSGASASRAADNRRRIVGSSCAAAVALAVVGVLLTGCGSGKNSAVTRIMKAADAQIVTRAGQTVAARPGVALHAGDQIRTGADGAAVLATGDRRAYLGPAASYTVRSRSEGVLDKGAFVVDARRGPALSITSGPVTARIDRATARLEHGFSVRVGVLAGRAISVTGDPANGPARLTLHSLHQVVVAGRGLTEERPLALTDDDAERLVVPDLVADDRQLTRTAEALDSGVEGRAIVRLASQGGLTPGGAAAQSASETALSIAMARAITGSAASGARLASDYQKALDLRHQGGSWGVVARLVGTDATATGRALDALLAGVPSAGTVLVAAPVAPATNNGSSSASPRNNSGGAGDNGGGDNGGPSGGGNPSPTPTPSPTPPAPVQQVVSGVLGLLPPPLHQPSDAPSSRSSCSVLGLVHC